METKVRNAEALTHALAHHAKELEPLVGCLALNFLTKLQPRDWRLEQSSTGAQSFAIKGHGREYHLRGHHEPGRGYTGIFVKDRYHRGSEVAVLKSRVDVLRFVEDRVKES